MWNTIKTRLLRFFEGIRGRVAHRGDSEARASLALSLEKGCKAQEELELCRAKLHKILEDGSVIEVCEECGREWLWVLRGNEPYKVFESRGVGCEWVEVCEFESNKNE